MTHLQSPFYQFDRIAFGNHEAVCDLPSNYQLLGIAFSKGYADLENHNLSITKIPVPQGTIYVIGKGSANITSVFVPNG